jgi:hypothetical protein
LNQEHRPVFAPLDKQDQRLTLIDNKQSNSAQLVKNLQARLKIGEGEYFEF